MTSEATAGKIVCTQCGGESPLPSGERFVRCGFCGATLFVDRSGVVNHYRLPPLVGEEEARAALRRWMAGNETVKNLDKKSRIEELAAVSFPMWLFRVEGRTGEEVMVEPAAPTPIPQLADLKVPAGKLEPVSAEAAAVERVTATVPLATAREWLEQRKAGPVIESALVQVPLWRCRYVYEGHEFQALVEASTGTVLAAVYPEKAESPYVLVAILGVLIFGIEGLLISDLLAKAAVYALTAVPLTLVAYWVTRKV